MMTRFAVADDDVLPVSPRPTQYRTLFPDLRHEPTTAAAAARAAGLACGPRPTPCGADVNELESLRNEVAIKPKLVRRLVDYCAG